MKNENPKEIFLIYMHGLNLLAVAMEFKQWLANYLRESCLPSGAMLMRVIEGHVVMHSLKWVQESPRDILIWDGASHFPADIKAAATQSMSVCFWLSSRQL